MQKDDVIYRQQAIDGMRKLQRWNVVRENNKNEGFLYDDVMYLLDKLPPAELEIIRCKDCKWCEDADGSTCKNPASWVVATDCDFGCVLAERKEYE